ncbi:MAG: hypothetical protein PSV36_13880 [Algoriphagus sp.]|nr:hypothetical protein [Algoriphagus sp.]
MKKLFTNFLGLALSVMVLASCSQMATYEQADVTPEEVAAAKNGFNLTPYGTGGNENAIVLDCNNSCITDTSADQFAVTTTSAPVTWGGPNQNNNSKTLSVKVWNTLTTIEYRFTLISNLGSIPGSNLQYFDEATQLWVNIGDLVPGVVKVVSRPLPAAWTKCQVITEQWRQTGGGAPVELGNVSYSLIGICTTTTIAKDSETSVCIEDGTVNLTGTVTSFGTFTGGNIKIQQFNGVSYVDVASEAVGDGILVYAFDPSVSGTYTFRAAYDGTGSNGYNNSVSSDITVEAVNCVVACTESFSYVENQDGSYTFTYKSEVDITGAEVKFTSPQVTEVTSGDIKTYAVNPGNGQGSPTVSTWVGDITACTPITFTLLFTPDCEQNEGGFANLWTDFKVNSISKKNISETNPIIKFDCPK